MEAAARPQPSERVGSYAMAWRQTPLWSLGILSLLRLQADAFVPAALPTLRRRNGISASLVPSSALGASALADATEVLHAIQARKRRSTPRLTLSRRPRYGWRGVLGGAGAKMPFGMPIR